MNQLDIVSVERKANERVAFQRKKSAKNTIAKAHFTEDTWQ
jgi:hypothetical protein